MFLPHRPTDRPTGAEGVVDTGAARCRSGSRAYGRSPRTDRRPQARKSGEFTGLLGRPMFHPCQAAVGAGPRGATAPRKAGRAAHASGFHTRDGQSNDDADRLPGGTAFRGRPRRPSRVALVARSDRAFNDTGEEDVKKSDLAPRVAFRLSIPKGVADTTVNALFSATRDALAPGEPVSTAGFGTFSVTNPTERPGRNPRTGESTTVAASNVPMFKPGRELRNAVGRCTFQTETRNHR